MGNALEQRILDAVADLQATTGRAALEADVRLRLLPPPATLEERGALDEAIQELLPRFVERGGLPAGQTLSLRDVGWLKSSLRADVEELAGVFLETYRALAKSGSLQDRQISWTDLRAHGLRPGLRGLVYTAASELHMHCGGSFPAPSDPPDGLSLHLPWDVGELLHFTTVNAFLEYRARNPAARVNFFQRLRMRLTGEIQRAIDEVSRAATRGWPRIRPIEVSLRRRGDELRPAIEARFARVLFPDRVDARVSLTYEGLLRATDAGHAQGLVLDVIRGMVHAYASKPMRELIPARKLIEANLIDSDDLQQALLFLEGQSPPVVAGTTDWRKADLLLDRWLLDVRDVETFSDFVYALGRSEEQDRLAQLDRAAVLGASSRDETHLSDEAELDQLEGLPDPHLRLGEPIGEGEYGLVYFARDSEFDRDVAVKIVRNAERAMETIVDHGRALARGSHPAVVRLYRTAIVRDPVSQALTPALVMEYVGGHDLPVYLGLRPLSRKELASFGATIIDAVDAIHDEQACHGDLHANQIRICNGNLRLLDLYHRRSTLYVSTQSLEEHQRVDRQAVRDIVARMVEKSEVGPAGSDACATFQRIAQGYDPTLDVVRDALERALASSPTSQTSVGGPDVPVKATVETNTEPKRPVGLLHRGALALAARPIEILLAALNRCEDHTHAVQRDLGKLYDEIPADAQSRLNRVDLCRMLLNLDGAVTNEALNLAAEHRRHAHALAELVPWIAELRAELIERARLRASLCGGTDEASAVEGEFARVKAMLLAAGVAANAARLRTVDVARTASSKQLDLLRHGFHHALQHGQWLDLGPVDEAAKQVDWRDDVIALAENLQSFGTVLREDGKELFAVGWRGAYLADPGNAFFSLHSELARRAADAWATIEPSSEATPQLDEAEVQTAAGAIGYEIPQGGLLVLSRFLTARKQPFLWQPDLEYLRFANVETIEQFVYARSLLGQSGSAEDGLWVLEELLEHWRSTCRWPAKRSFVLGNKDRALRVFRGLRLLNHDWIAPLTNELLCANSIDSVLLGCGDVPVREWLARIVGAVAELSVTAGDTLEFEVAAQIAGTDRRIVAALADVGRVGDVGLWKRDGQPAFRADRSAQPFKGVRTGADLASRWREVLALREQRHPRIEERQSIHEHSSRFDERTLEEKLRLIEDSRCLAPDPRAEREWF